MKDLTRVPDGLSDQPDGGHIGALKVEELRPGELANELERALDAMTEESYDPTLISTCLDALERAAPVPEGRSAEEALRDLRGRLHAMTGGAVDDRASSPSRGIKRRKWVRFGLAIAATMVLTLGLMVSVQAAGFDIFGAIAQWTDETFGVRTAQDERIELIRDTFAKYGMPLELVPTWLPEDCLAQEPEVYVTVEGCYIVLPFSRDKGELRIRAWRYDDSADLDFQTYERSAGEENKYMSNGRLFYIFTNFNGAVATWSDGKTYVVDFEGQVVEREIKRIVDSIGGIT